MSEKGSSMWLKAMAVTSAVALGGGYVVWKDGQAKNARIDALEQRVAEWEEAEEDVTLFVGSKSPGREVLNFETVENPGDQMLMPGSKSGAVVLPPVGDPEEVPPAILMPGSKSFLLVPPAGKEEKKDPAVLIPSSKSITPIFETRKEEEKP